MNINTHHSPFGSTFDIERGINDPTSVGYRYGWNKGSEKDDEITGVTGSHITTYFREFDTRLGRTWSRDPKVTAYESPYISMANNPILFNDPLGDVVKYSGKGARGAVRQDRRASRKGDGQFEKDFQRFKDSDDVFYFSKVGNGNARKGYATNPSTSFSNDGSGNITLLGASSMVHQSTTEGDGAVDVTTFRFTGRPSEKVVTGNPFGVSVANQSKGRVVGTSDNLYTSGTIELKGAATELGIVGGTDISKVKLTVIVRAGGQEIYRANLPIIPFDGTPGYTLTPAPINFTVNNSTGSSAISIAIIASDKKSAEAGKVTAIIKNNVQ